MVVPRFSLEDHMDDLKTVVSVFAEHMLRLNVNECKFLKTTLTFFGYIK